MAKGLAAEELRNKLADELVDELREKKEELFNLRFQAATGQLESHGRLRAVRREIARIYTVMRERELGIIVVAEEPVDTAGADKATDSADTDSAKTAKTTGSAKSAKSSKSSTSAKTAETASVEGGSDG